MPGDDDDAPVLPHNTEMQDDEMSVNMRKNMCTYLVESGLVWLANPFFGAVQSRGNADATLFE